jgi:hypothetical protein
MSETPQEYIARILSYQQGKVPIKILASTSKAMTKLIRGKSAAQLKKRLQPEKWSVAEIIAHLADTELVFGFRVRLALGQNGVTIQAFDQDAWADFGEYGKTNAKESLATFTILREHNLRMLKGLPKEMWENFGMHTERGKENVTRMSEMFAGHDLNHLIQIEKILKRKKQPQT